MQNKNLQAAVNALQMQMVGFIPPNEPTVNAVNRQQPPAHNAVQQQAPPQYGNYNGSGNVASWQSPPTQPQYYQQQQQQQHGNFQPPGGVNNKTGVAADMATATDLDECMHREGETPPNKCRTQDSPQKGSRTRRIGTLSPERYGQTTNPVVNEDNVSNNGRIITRGHSNSRSTECHSGTSKIARGHSNSSPTEGHSGTFAHCPLIFHFVTHTDTP